MTLWFSSFRHSGQPQGRKNEHRDHLLATTNSSFLNGRRQHQQQPGPSSDLWDLVLDMDWERVVDHASAHPEDAQWTDGHYHETVLYLACQHNPPVSAIRAILRAYPKAAAIQNTREHDLPLHIACRYQLDEKILKELVHDFPRTAIQQTRWGGTPLMNLWKFRLKQDENGTSAVPMRDDIHFWNKVLLLVTAVARHRENTTCKKRHSASGRSAFKRCPTDGSLDAGNRNRNDSFDDSLLQADTDSASADDPHNSALVHAAVSLGALCCPLEVFEHVLDQFPEQAFARDSRGQLPLHIAVGPSSWNESTRRKYRPREQEFVTALLRIHPDAAKAKLEDRTTNHDRHPLHVALANRHLWSGGVAELFQAAPNIVLRQDPVTCLYPFQLAAMPSGDTTVDLETIYQLLRSRPEILNIFEVERTSGLSMDTHQGSRDLSSIPSQGTKSTGGGYCPRLIQQAILGAAIALLIGGVAGTIFAN